MQNQHELIKGYRDLTQAEIDLINEIKQKADEVGDLYLKVSNLRIANESLIDLRWLAIAQTDLQKGFMGLVRSVARPQSF